MINNFETTYREAHGRLQGFTSHGSHRQPKISELQDLFGVLTPFAHDLGTLVIGNSDVQMAFHPIYGHRFGGRYSDFATKLLGQPWAAAELRTVREDKSLERRGVAVSSGRDKRLLPFTNPVTETTLVLEAYRDRGPVYLASISYHKQDGTDLTHVFKESPQVGTKSIAPPTARELQNVHLTAQKLARNLLKVARNPVT